MLGTTLLDWYDQSRRPLPWRAMPGETADPWAVLVSEVMLQQTTVATVRARYAAFLDRFPTPAAMAAAPLDEVLHAWQGLGYYRRARALKAAAMTVMDRHGGRLPRTAAALRALPGVGAYTAAAVAAIAHAEPVVPIDGNVARVLARLLAHDRPLSPGKNEFAAVAQALAHGERPGDLAQALMELGALVCRPRQPACAACPWAFACRARAQDRTVALPVKQAKPPRPRRHAAAMLIRDARGRIGLCRRPDSGLLAGLIELPTSAFVEEASADDAALMATLPPGAWRALPGRVQHVFTHFSLTVTVFAGRPEAPVAEAFFHSVDRLHELALPTLTKKLLRHAGIEPAGAK